MNMTGKSDRFAKTDKLRREAERRAAAWRVREEAKRKRAEKLKGSHGEHAPRT